jgi:hypothetical protein
LDAVKASVSLSKWRKATRVMLELAMGGDVKAFTCLAKLLVPEDSVLAELVDQLRGQIQRLEEAHEQSTANPRGASAADQRGGFAGGNGDAAAGGHG